MKILYLSKNIQLKNKNKNVIYFYFLVKNRNNEKREKCTKKGKVEIRT